MTFALATLVDQKGWLVVDLTGAASAANAGLGEIANPEGVTLGIVRAFLKFATGSAGAANLDLGIGASGAKASDIVSAMDVIQATVVAKLIHAPAAQVAETENPTALWTATTYLTATGSASTVGLAAKLYLEYIRLA
jgi:hypothetical protein